jgi:hypothetical protein
MDVDQPTSSQITKTNYCMKYLFLLMLAAVLLLGAGCMELGSCGNGGYVSQYGQPQPGDQSKPIEQRIFDRWDPNGVLNRPK